MKDKLQQIREKAIAEIEGSDGLERLNEVRQAVLGKKGELTAVLKGMKDVAPEDRPKSRTVGKRYTFCNRDNSRRENEEIRGRCLKEKI